MAAAIEAGCLSNKDLLISTPTLEELGLLEVQDIKERWQVALKASEDQRSANIAKNVRNQDTKELLQEASDVAVQKAVAEAVKDMRVYVFVDISGSMHAAIEQAKEYLAKFVQAFPLDKLHVCTFNTVGREISIKAASSAGVTQAFRGKLAGGGTDFRAGINCLKKYQPTEGEDVLFIFVTDEGAIDFQMDVRRSGLNPMAFGLIKVGDSMRNAVTNTATSLGIPCFQIKADTFEDPYAIPRTIHAIVASTPVGAVHASPTRAPRVTLVNQILQTDLLQKPAWAAA
jgi:hypothetical protein